MKQPQPIKVTAAIIEVDGKVLVGKRARGRFAGMWEFPGGKVEVGETPEECLARELLEELGVGASIGPLFLSSVHAYSHVAIELLTYRARLDSYDFRLTDHTEVRWVAIEDLEYYDFPKADEAVIDKLRSSVHSDEANSSR